MTFPQPWENPILTKELRTRMRGAKAFWILLTYLGLLSLILGGTYFAWWRTPGRESDAASYEVGRLFYAVLFAVQAALVGLITPALTSGALSIEREQRTFEALAASPLSRRAIVLGKLTAAVAFVGLLLIATLPLVALCFLLGGVSPGEVSVAYLLLLASAFLFGATGIAYSSFAKTTSAATVLTYGTILLFFLGTLPLVLNSTELATASLRREAQPFLLAVNPVGAMLAGDLTEVYFGAAIPAWLTALSVNLLFGTLLTVVALHRIEYPRSDRTPWLRGLTAALISLLALYSFGHDPHWSCLLPLYVVVLVPFFASGESLPRGPLQKQLFHLKDGNPVSGLGFLVLLFFPVSLLAAAGQFFRIRDALNYGFTLQDLRWPLENGVGVPLLLTLSALFGFGTLSLWLSAKLKNRWGALALSFAILAVVYFLPFSAVLGPGQHRTAFPHALALSPLACTQGIRAELGPSGASPAAMPWVNISLTTLLGLSSLALLQRRKRAL